MLELIFEILDRNCHVLVVWKKVTAPMKTTHDGNCG